MEGSELRDRYKEKIKAGIEKMDKLTKEFFTDVPKTENGLPIANLKKYIKRMKKLGLKDATCPGNVENDL